MAARADSGITTLDGLAGKVVCVGAGTTYLDWLGGTLDFGTESPQTAPPEGATSTTQDTDRLCAEAWKAGRTEFDGWLSSSTTVQDAIDDGLPVVPSATRSSTSRSPSPSTRAARTRATWSRGSTRSSPRCARTERSRRCPRSGSAQDLTEKQGG